MAQKKYAIQKCERIAAFVTDPEMSDIEKYYKLALWENDHVTYDNEFWCGGYDFSKYRHQWDAYGALTDTSVCAGIAILYSNLCHAADLPCKFVRTDPTQLDHTINYIPDINGNAYYIDVTESYFFGSETANPFGDMVDKKFAFITKSCTDGSFEYKDEITYEDAVEHKEKVDSKKGETLSWALSDIKGNYKTPFSAWFKEYALHENTKKQFKDEYVEKGSGRSGEHYAHYHDYPKQFSADEKPGIWFLEDFYKDPEAIKTKVLGKEIDQQLVNVGNLESSYDCENSRELETTLNDWLVLEYFPTAVNGEIVPQETNIFADEDYKVTVKSFDKAKGKAVVAINGMGDYKGSYQFTVNLTKPSVQKAANPMKVKAGKETIKYKKLRKKAKVIKRSKLLRVRKAQGKVTYTLAAAKKGKKSFKKFFKIGRKSGNVKVRKGLKKGTYKLKVKVKAAGNKTYKAATKTVTLKIKVK